MHCSTFVDRFIVKVGSEAERRIQEADRVLWEAETLRCVPGRDPDLPAFLLTVVSDHLIPLAIELGDLGTKGKAVEVRVSHHPLFYSQLVPIDTTDGEMPVFSSDRVSDGALILLAESSCMQIQVLMRLWNTLASRLFVVDPVKGFVVGTVVPGAEVISTANRYTRMAEHTRTLANGIMGASFRAQADVARSSLVNTLRALLELAEGLSVGVSHMLACQSNCQMTMTEMHDDRRLSLTTRGAAPMAALLRCATDLGRLHGWPVTHSHQHSIDLRVESWREDLREVHLIYAFVFYAISAMPTEMNYLRPLVAATARANEQLLVATFTAVGPREHVTSIPTARDERGVPKLYSFLGSEGGQRPAIKIPPIAGYRAQSDQDEAAMHPGEYTRLGFALRQTHSY